MNFSELADLYSQLEKISSTNAMRSLFAKFFKKVPKNDIDKVAYLSLGQIASEHEAIVIGMADKMVLKSIAKASGRKEDDVRKLFKTKGDVGLVAEATVGKRTKKLTIDKAFHTLHDIARASGAGSQEKKISLFAQLLKDASPLEARYLARIVTGSLRLGAGEKIVLDGLLIAFTGSTKAKKEIDYACSICPDVGIIGKTLAQRGIKAVKKIGVELGRPIQSMLCHRVKSLAEVEKKIGYPVAVEEKYDGERIQVHKDGKKVNLFSRRLENISSQFPDIIEAVKKAVKAKRCILDCEAMPIDEKGNFLPFQSLMQRRRKYEVEKYIKKIPVVLFVFDILALGGKSLIREKYQKRYALLQKNLRQTNKVKLALHKICRDASCIEDLFKITVKHGGEGLVIKNLNGVYEAGVRGWNWVKWKPEYVKGLRDTFDLVVIGGFKGRGKRAGTYGALLCASYNKGEFETFCKLGSGFTDKELSGLVKKFRKYEVSKKPARVKANKFMEPDVWFSPHIVVEVIGAEITRSPHHTCAIDKGKGLALRFPRFSRWRDDKRPSQATTSKEILQMVKKKKKR